MNAPICDRGERWLDIGAALPAWIGRKGFAFRSLFEVGLDERGQVRDSLSLRCFAFRKPYFFPPKGACCKSVGE